MFTARKLAAAITLTTVGLTGCAMNGEGWANKQQIGSVLGAVAGGLLGSTIGGGSGRTIAIIAGALAGGLLGNTIGASLDERDRQALAASTQEALVSGKAVDWQSAHSGATARITPVSSKTVDQQADVKRSPKIAAASNLTLLNQPYQARRSVNLRAAPENDAARVGGFAAGQTFTALGRTNNNWIAVGRKGVTVGYVHAPLVAPVVAAKANDATDLDTISVASAEKSGFDLDAIEPAAPITEKIAVQTTCRTVKYDVTTSAGQESKTVDACQAADGAWQLG